MHWSSRTDINYSCMAITSSQDKPWQVLARGFRDCGNPAWVEHFLELVSLIIKELSLFG